MTNWARAGLFAVLPALALVVFIAFILRVGIAVMLPPAFGGLIAALGGLPLIGPQRRRVPSS
jgi:hypothetical protein